MCKERKKNLWAPSPHTYSHTQLLLTRYLSEETLTRMRSSPTLTFSPSERCFDAGWMVHQHASPTHTYTNAETKNSHKNTNNISENKAEVSAWLTDSHSNIKSCNTTYCSVSPQPVYHFASLDLSCSCSACTVICIIFTEAGQEQEQGRQRSLLRLIVLTLFWS